METLSRLRDLARSVPILRILGGTALGFSRHRAGHMAASLSFQTLVSMVPVLLFLVGMMRRLIPGESEQDLYAFMSGYLVPEVATRVTDEISYIVRSFNFAAMGWIGAVGTFLATFMLVLNLKACLNALGFKSSRSGFFRRIGWVTLVVMILPPLSWFIVSESRVFFSLPSFLTILRPYVSTMGVLFLVYRFLPDRGPSTASSLIAASVVSLFLEFMKLGLSYYVKQFSGLYELIYGTLMFLPLALAWLYLSWCLMLLGANMAWCIDEVTGRRKPTHLPLPA